MTIWRLIFIYSPRLFGHNPGNNEAARIPARYVDDATNTIYAVKM